MDPLTRLSHATSFERAALVYARSRPSYPAEAVNWLVGGAEAVLDLGAGAGALTAVLIDLPLRVTAAEPSPSMLAQLTRAAPGAVGVQALAERLPFAAASFDLVTVAQAFHWFDHETALPDISRVLRLGGTLGVIYNTRDESDAFVQALSRLLTSIQPPTPTGDWGAGSVQAIEGSAHFGQVQSREFTWRTPMDRDRVVGLVASRSYVINLGETARRDVLSRTSELVDRHTSRAGRLEMPYVTQCWRATALSAT